MEAFKKAESTWLLKEKELHVLLLEAQNQIEVKLTDLKSIPPAASNKTAETNKETCTESKFTDEASHWKELYEESETRIADLNNNILSVKDDIVFTESCYERQLNSLQKQLAKVQENLRDAERELASEKESCKEAIDKNNQLETNKIELEHNNMVLKNENSTLEKKFKNQCELLQNEISTLKETIAQLRKELKDEKERYGKLKVDYEKLKVDYEKLTETAISENTSMVSTRLSMESEYDKKNKDLAAECNNWKSKYLDVEKENAELDRNLQLQLSNVTKTESYFKKQVETLQSEIETLNKSMNQVQSELFVEKERSTKFDLECKQMTKNYNMNLENVLNVEKVTCFPLFFYLSKSTINHDAQSDTCSLYIHNDMLRA